MQDDILIRDLLNQLGFFIKTITDRKIILVGESVIQKQAEPYCMVEEAMIAGPNWHSNEALDPDTGQMVQTYNSTVEFIITMAKDDPVKDINGVPTPNRRTSFNDARKVKHAFHLPWINYEYFKDGRFAFASCTDPVKQRIPLDSQTFESRTRFVVTFNVVFRDEDYGAFEILQKVRVTSDITDANNTSTYISEIELPPV